MASPTERIRAFRGDRRSKVAIRSIIRGDSIWLRGLIFVIMSGIFFLLVSLTKKSGLQSQGGSTSDSTEVTAPAQHATSPPASASPAQRTPTSAPHAPAPATKPTAAPKPTK